MEGWQAVWNARWIAASIGAFSLSNLSSATFFVLGPFVAASHLGGAAGWGLLLSAGGTGGILGGVLAVRWTPKYPLRMGFLLALLIPVQLLGLAIPLPLIGLLILGALTVAARTVTNAFWDTALQRVVPVESISRVSSYDWFASLVFTPIGLGIAGPLAEIIGPQATLIAASALSAAVNLGVLAVPTVRNLSFTEHSR
jgi:hypothetical protein